MKRCVLLLSFILVLGCASAPIRTVRIPRSCPPNYIYLAEFCANHGLLSSLDTLDDMVRVYSAQHEFRLLINSPVGYVNGNVIDLGAAPLYYRGQILLPRALEKIIVSGETSVFKPAYAIKTIVVDAGHGGKDPGAISVRGMQEKEVNLTVARLLSSELTRRGFKVVLTRERDAYLTLRQRVGVAKKHNADLFISIHANSNRSRKVKGVEVYYLAPERMNSYGRAVRLAKEQSFQGKAVSYNARAILWDMVLEKGYALSIEFSQTLYQGFKQMGFSVALPKKAPFYVLKNASVPAVLVEMGYLSNWYEEKMLRQSHYQKQIAEAIALGVMSLNKRYTTVAGR